MSKKILIPFIFFLFLLPKNLLSQQHSQKTEENIIDFHSDIRIDSSGGVEVTEHIKVFANQIQIKRGIFRKIPLYRTNKFGKQRKVDIQLLSVLRNGNPENYKSEVVNDYLEVYIGNANYILSPNFYEFTITYISHGHVGFFDDFDELYWNVTGNEWLFSIEKTSATIYLPAGSKVLTGSCYTGIKGSTEQSCSFIVDEQNPTTSISFYADRSLAPFEGLTVAVSFPKDIVKRPPPPNSSVIFWIQNGLYISSPILLFIFICYCYITWRKVGKDPYKPTVIPTFNPPRGFSPAVIRYLYDKRYDIKTFSSTIINLAVNQFIKIDTNTSSLKLTRLSNNNTEELSNEDQTVLELLFRLSGSNTIEMVKHSQTLSSVNNMLKNKLLSDFNLTNLFKSNTKYSIRAFIIMFILITINCLLTLNPETISLLLIIVLPLVLLTYALISFGLTKKSFTRSLCIILGISFFIFSLVFIFGLTKNIVLSSFLLCLFILFYIYDYLIKAPSKEEVDIIAEIEGFKMYLKTAEEHRLNMLITPEHTTELFEKMLPYAIALDLENEWGQKFNNLLEQANYSPEWCNGYERNNYRVFSSNITITITSSINKIQASTRYGSTSSRRTGGSGGSRSSSSSSSGGSWSSGSRGGGGGGGGGW